MSAVVCSSASASPWFGFSAPTGRNISAQGNALGRAGKEVRALKGRHHPQRLGWAAPSGLDVRLSVTQGVALGWYGSGLWPERQMRWEGLGI